MNGVLKCWSRCLVLFLIALSAGSAFCREQPNVIVILTDDQGYGDLGRHGHPFLKTPNLDRVYDESVRFDNFYVSPSCSPTRAALLTGMHEFRSGVTHTINERERLSTEVVTLPDLMKTAGYRTGFVGKWHLGNDKEHAPAARGFEWCSTNAGGPHEHFDPVVVRNGKRSKREGFREDIFFDEAMTFIDESEEKPFFCYLATYSPHTPLGAPEEDIARYREHVGEKHASYLAMIDNIDQNVGRLLTFLKERELEDDTIVVFMNDNGVTEGLDVFNAGMRGCKCTIWEGGSRAMSFWRWPQRWKPQTVDNLTAHLDVLPTICELAGVTVPGEVQERLEGFSLLPLLEAEEATSWHDDRLLFHHVARWPSGLAASHKYAMCGVRQGHQLLLRSHSCDDPACKEHPSQCKTLRLVEKGLKKITYTEENAQYHWGVSAPERWSLFDVKKDPGCENDLALENPEKVKAMGEAYDKWWEDVYPEMVAAGGNKKAPETKNRRGQQRADKKGKEEKE